MRQPKGKKRKKPFRGLKPHDYHQWPLCGGDICNSGLVLIAEKSMNRIDMSPWLQTAREMFPELLPRFEQADTPYLLWFELHDEFIQAYSRSPRDENMIQRIYQYADWCIDQPQGRTAEDDLTTCVAVCFYEHIPQNINSRNDMPRWFTLEDYLGMQQIFRYHLSDFEFQELRQHFEDNKDMYVKPSWR